MEGKAIGRCKQDVVFDVVIFILLTLIFLIVAYPLYFVIISSFSDPVAVAGGKVTLYPVGITLDGYAKVFKTSEVMRGFANSLLYTFTGVAVNLLCTLPTSYALSRKDFPLRNPITFFYMVTMFVGGGMIPSYLVIKNTGLLNTMWALVIPGAVGVYNMIVARTFFITNIPLELMEAAKLDGCGNTRFFLSIVLPLSGAIIAILFLYYGVGHWNSYFNAMVYISDRSKYPLQVFLREILTLGKFAEAQFQAGGDISPEQAEALLKQVDTANMIKYAVIVVSTAPMMVIYPWVQKYFAKGVMIGSVKG